MKPMRTIKPPFNKSQWPFVLLTCLSLFTGGGGGGRAVAAEKPIDLGNRFIVHEWGTFTSLQGSDGKNQEGLHHEDEPLPHFVMGRCKLADGGNTAHGNIKCADFRPMAKTPLAVTQKMETPVIYFYSATPLQAKIRVGFKNGVISQWYPQAESFLPEIKNVKKLANGSMVWNVNISTDVLDLPFVPGDSVWAPSRNVAANSISVKDENEKFIFYRGLGKFDLDINVRSDSEDQIYVNNKSREAVPMAFLLHFDGQKGLIRPLGTMMAGETLQLKNPDLSREGESLEIFLQKAESLVSRALEDSGLYPDESKAMVDTWSRSYFLTPGLRVLYVLPRSWTDSILPLSVHPLPDETVRTLVGRIEIFTAKEEVSLLTFFKDAVRDGRFIPRNSLGRFAEAKLRRLLEVNEDPLVQEKINSLLK